MTDLDEAENTLRAGLVVAIPTDTVYGVAVDPRVPGATDRLFAAKRRPRERALPVLVSGQDQAATLVAGISPVAAVLMDRFWPGPLTIVLRRAIELTTADLGDERDTVGVRQPAHDVPVELARRVGLLAVSSANVHGQDPATDAAEVRRQLGDAVAAIVDGGKCDGAPSTVVDCTAEDPRLLRSGSLDWPEIQAAIKTHG